MVLWENVRISGQPAVKGTCGFHIGHVRPYAWSAEAPEQWAGTGSGTLQKAWFLLSPLLLYFQTIQVVLRPREERLVPGRKGGWVSNMKKRSWPLTSQSMFAQSMSGAGLSKVRWTLIPFQRHLAKFHLSNSTWCSDGNVLCLLPNMQPLTICSYGALQVWLVELRNWILTFK